MGCEESRCWTSGDKPKETVMEKQRDEEEEEEEEFLMDEEKCSVDQTDGCFSDPPEASGLLLDFAQRTSEDIVAQALQLCWTVEDRYKELPFIDSECDCLV